MIHYKFLRNPPLCRVIYVIALLIATQACSDNAGNPVPAKGKLSFSFTKADGPSNGRTSSEEVPASILVTVVNDDTQETKQYVRLELVAFGNGYVSQDLELAAGNYRLTDFYVHNAEKMLMYATPREGSGMAKFVEDPLDIEFGVHEGANAEIRPQVIAVDEDTSPEDFGYASFSFDIVDVTAFVLPELDEKITKVSYTFFNLWRKIEGERRPENGIIDLAEPKLDNNIWNAYITIWTEPKDCITTWSLTPYQKVYRLTTEMQFTGSAIQLPEIASENWEPMYYRASEGIGYFFSADPRRNYHTEIVVLDKDLEANYCWMDRLYWKANGGYTCQPSESSYTELDMNGLTVGKFRMKDQTDCETSDMVIVDSFIAVNSNKGARHEFFSWTIKNGVMVPTCDDGGSSLQVQQTRKGPRDL